MLGARRCNVVGDRPLVVLLGDIQDWVIVARCCTKFVQKIICVFFFLLGLSTCKMYSYLYDGIHPITRRDTLTKAIEVDMEDVFEMKTVQVQVPVLKAGVDLGNLNLRQLDQLRRALSSAARQTEAAKLSATIDAAFEKRVKGFKAQLKTGILEAIERGESPAMSGKKRLERYLVEFNLMHKKATIAATLKI